MPAPRRARVRKVASVGRIIELTCSARLTGLPQVSLPLAEHAGILK